MVYSVVCSCVFDDILCGTLVLQAIRKRLEQRQMMKRRSLQQKQQQQQENHDQQFDSKDIPRAALADGPEPAKSTPTEDLEHQRASLEDVDSSQSDQPRRDQRHGGELDETPAQRRAAGDGLYPCLECMCRVQQLTQLYIPGHAGDELPDTRTSGHRSKKSKHKTDKKTRHKKKSPKAAQVTPFGA